MKSVILICCFCLAGSAVAQVVIDQTDLLNQIGYYSLSHMNSGSEWATNGVQGNTGGPQVWDFSTGPADRVAVIEIVNKNDSAAGASFPSADYAELQHFQDGDDATWWFYEYDASGQHLWGIYNDDLFPDHPTNVFSARITDYPSEIEYGDTWSGTTYFNTVVEGQSGRVRYQANYSADAYGTLIVPQATAECLRINRLVQLDFQINLPFIGWVTIVTQYVRTYMWLAENRGMAASLVSTQSDSVPGNNFSSAISFTRIFETNIPGANPGEACDLPLEIACDTQVYGVANPDIFPNGVYYELEIAEPTQLDLDLLFIDSISDLDLYLLNEECDETLSHAISITDNEHISYLIETPGTYKLRVLNYSGLENEYTLGVACQAPSCDPVSQLRVINSAGELALDWDAVSGASSYRILFSLNQDGPYATLAETTATDHNLAPTTARGFYKVVAICE